LENKNKIFATIVTAIMLFSFISLVQVLPVAATSPTANPYLCNDSAPSYTGSFNYCRIHLVLGWNLVSLPVVPNSTALTAAQILKPAYNQFFVGAANSVNNVFNRTGIEFVTSVYTYNGHTWSFCITKSLLLGACSNTMTMVDGSAYWVLTTSANVALAVGGWIIQPASAPPGYSLVKGWNLVGFKPQPSIGVEETGTYLSSLGSNYDTAHVYSWDNVNGAWVLLGGTDNIPVGNGMWVFLTSAQTLYP